MKQTGLKLNSSSVIDQLEYNYYSNSNKLKNVRDAQNEATTVLGDFRSSQLYMDALGGSKAQSATDYTYDPNGNLKKDLNKDIGDASTEGIQYNYLNLPYLITIKSANGTKGTISYIYDALGNKIEKRVVDNTNNSNPNNNTTYVGPFVYETDKLQFITHEEGRVRVKESIVNSQIDKQYVYDYFVKDHLGNVRMLLTEEVQKDIYPIASLENANSVALEGTYYRIDAVNIIDKTLAGQATGEPIPDFANKNTGVPTNNSNINEEATSQKLYRLNGNGTKMGLSITLKVMAGDVVDIFAKSYWNNGAGNSMPAGPGTTDILQLLKDFVGNGLPGNKQGITGDALNAIGDITTGLGGLLSGQEQTTLRPKAYVNWILFDEHFRPVSTGSNSGFSQAGTKGQLTTHSNSTGEITKNGYLYIYCSNESKLDVFFDNLQVVHSRGALLEETHYYPFGLAMSGINSKALNGMEANKIKFQSQEFATKEFSDGTGLDMYEFKWRMHDPQIGRFWQGDPLSNKYVYNSTYAFSENKVTTHVELEGLEAFFIHGTSSSSARWRENKNTVPTLMKLTNNMTSNTGFNWKAPLTNDEKTRAKAAKQLADYVIANRVKGEEITLVGHSHGGNVAIQASKLISEITGEKVNLITIATPAYNKTGDVENPQTQKAYINDHIALWNKRDVVSGGLAGDDNYTNSSVTRNVEVNVDKWYVNEVEVNAGHGETTTQKRVDGYGAHSFDVQHPESIITTAIKKLISIVIK